MNSPSRPQVPAPSIWAAVALGGAVGALLRWGVTAAEGPIPAQTLAINLIGSGVLAYLAATVFLDRHRPAWLRPLVGTGLIGGFTTFSAVVTVSTVHAIDGRWAIVLGYLTATLIGGMAATALGDRLGARHRRRR